MFGLDLLRQLFCVSLSIYSPTFKRNEANYYSSYSIVIGFKEKSIRCEKLLQPAQRASICYYDEGNSFLAFSKECWEVSLTWIYREAFPNSLIQEKRSFVPHIKNFFPQHIIVSCIFLQVSVRFDIMCFEREFYSY
jgi:hypothetical protein